ncbi:MAG: hypothetical protein KAX63_09715 [Pseudomonas sp.]|nr:hypothetical protein [Pseudomonas sp.]
MKLDPQRSLEAMHATGPVLAQARADRVYAEEYRKSLKAILMKEHAALPAVAQEREAYADPRYLQHLDALKVAVEAEEAARWRMVTAQAAVEVWRTLSANDRGMDRGTR